MLLLTVCTISAQIIAQKTKTANAIPPPPPPPVVMNDVPPPPPPQPPPLPPSPPNRPEQVKFTPPSIVNELGYDLSVRYDGRSERVYMKKKGVTEKVSLTKWSANKSYYEKKYGVLSPPPAPPTINN